MSVDTLIIVVVSGVVIIGIGFLIWIAGRSRQRDLAAQWEQLMQQAQETGLRVAYISRVYQRAASGTKAEIIWWGTGRNQDAWLPNWQASSGVFVLLRGNTGYGSHNRSDDVFFAKSDGIKSVTTGEAYAAWKRQHRSQPS